RCGGCAMSTMDISRGRKAGLFNAVKRRLGMGPPATMSQAQKDVVYLDESGLFDRQWYLDRYQDVAASVIDPVEHYVLYGADENRNPCALFDTQYYRESNPDVAVSGINLFRHFCEFGWREGRDPSAGFDLKRYIAQA